MAGDKMYQPEFYKDLTPAQICDKVIEEGFNPIRIVDPPGRVYPPHQHAETKLLAFLEGAMDVTVQGEQLFCKAGDKLLIPGNIEHSAVVKAAGCTYFWSEKLIS
jgi:quercetin dioxygenase-like cupin family protein